MLVGVFALVAAGGLFWLAYRRPRPRRWLLPRRQLVPTRAAGGAARETPLPRPPVGDPEAELGRPLGRDGSEQVARWGSAAAALRRLNRLQTLPAVLRCADAAAGFPHAAALAAEAVGFANFPATLHDPAGVDGRLAVRALTRAARGGRDGLLELAPLVLTGLGDLLATVSETAPAAADPWLTGAVAEAERAARRAEGWGQFLPTGVRPLVVRQVARLAASAGRRRTWLRAAVPRLINRFPIASSDEQGAILRALDDLRADVSALFPSLPDRRAAWWGDAVRCLRWAVGRDYGPPLAELAERLLVTRQPGSACATVVTALRGRQCSEAERVLLAAATHPDGSVRRAALGALGWADPCDRVAVVGQLKVASLDSDAGVRRAATAAHARFGGLAALRELALGLLNDDPGVRKATCLVAAEEGVSWLWPDLDLVAGHADPETALAAAEGLERMREAALGLLG